MGMVEFGLGQSELVEMRHDECLEGHVLFARVSQAYDHDLARVALRG